MRRALDSIPPIKSDLLPPVDALAAGVTPDGRQLYRRGKQVVTTEPKINPQTGEQLWRINQMGQQTVAGRRGGGGKGQAPETPPGRAGGGKRGPQGSGRRRPPRWGAAPWQRRWWTRA